MPPNPHATVLEVRESKPSLELVAVAEQVRILKRLLRRALERASETEKRYYWLEQAITRLRSERRVREAAQTEETARLVRQLTETKVSLSRAQSKVIALESKCCDQNYYIDALLLIIDRPPFLDPPTATRRAAGESP